MAVAPVYLTRQDVARRFGMSVASIGTLLRAGKLPYIRVGACYRIPLHELEAWEAEQLAATRAQAQAS